MPDSSSVISLLAMTAIAFGWLLAGAHRRR
jgi:hypothetical protein